MTKKLLDQMELKLEQMYPELVDIRRDLHRYPELSFQEKETPRKIADYLRKLDIEVRERVGGNGVVGKLVGGKPGKTIALRADFDALPIQDEKQVEYRSQIDGVMHACGHDLHTAALLGTATILSKYREQIEGTIVFIHQFGEEQLPGGAQAMIEDGCLDDVDVIYGAHVWSPAPIGEVWLGDQAFTANSDRFHIEINGKGGHSSAPHMAIDPISIGCHLVLHLQHLTTKRIDPFSPAVIQVGMFQGGTSVNVIPDSITIGGTVRTTNEETRTFVEEQIKSIAQNVCESAGAQATVEYTRGYPAVWNDPIETNKVELVAKSMFGNEGVHRITPLLIGEDFAYYTQRVPGAFFLVGGGNEEKGMVYPHHHPMFDADERSMLYIAKIFISLVMERER